MAPKVRQPLDVAGIIAGGYCLGLLLWVIALGYCQRFEVMDDVRDDVASACCLRRPLLFNSIYIHSYI